VTTSTIGKHGINNTNSQRSKVLHH